MIKGTLTISAIVTVIATLVTPFLAEFIGSLTTRRHAHQSSIIGINSSLVWRQRRDVRAYASGITVKLTTYGELSVLPTIVLLAVLFHFAPAVVSMLLGRANVNQTIVYLFAIALVLSMTWFLLWTVGRNTKRYPLALTELGYSLRSADFLYSAKFLRRNAFLLGMSIAFPVFLVVYALAVAGTINRVLVIGGIVTGLALLATLIVGSVQSIRIVKDQLFLRAAILSTNHLRDEVLPSDREQFVYCKCAMCTIFDRISSRVSKLRVGICRPERERFRTTAKRFRPLICSQPRDFDLVSTDFENQDPNDARVLYDAVLLKDGQTTFKVIEILDCRRLSNKNLCVAQVDIHYLSSKDIELTAPDLDHCDRVSSGRVQLVWVPDGYDTEFSKLFGLSLKEEDSH